MKRTILRLILMLMLCVPCGYVHADGSVTVNNGTATNSYVPVYFAFLDVPYMHSQFIVPAAEMAAASGNALSSMQFYLTTAITTATTNNWRVTLMETTQTTLSTSYVDVTAGVVVYTGNINWQTTSPVITFNVPFTYHGGNLIVDMRYDNSPNATYEFSSFNGISATKRSVMSAAYAVSTTGTTQNFAPKATFTYTTPPSCSAPTALAVAQIASTTATVTWTTSGGGETQYQYVAVQSGGTPNWSNAVRVSTTSCTLTGLAPNTEYDLYVRSYCSQSSQSAAAKIIFQTMCAAVTPEEMGIVGFENTEGFYVGYGNLNDINCWHAGNANTTRAEYIPYVTDTKAYEGGNSMVLSAMRNTWYNYDVAYAVLPELDFATGNITQYEVSFYACKSSSGANYNDTLWVGMMTNPTDFSTFSPVGYAIVNTTSFSLYTVSLAQYAGAGRFVALKANVNQNSTATARYAGFNVDNMAVSRTPQCRAVTALTTSDITRTSVTVRWQTDAEVENSEGYQVLCSTNPDPGQATESPVSITPATVHTYSVTGLERNTTYYISVRSNCGAEDGYSEWVTTQITTRNLQTDCRESGFDTLVTDSNIVEYVPWGGNYKSYYSQQIYSASELKASGLQPGYIGRLSFLYTLSSAYTKRVTLYMGVTADTVMTAAYKPVTQVSDPVTVTFDSTGGWTDFDLTTPFYWDTTYNIVVGMMATGNDYPGYEESAVFAGGEKTAASAYSYTDNGTPDMENGTVTNNRANMRLSICPLESGCPAVTEVRATDVAPRTATIAWRASEGDYANTYDLYYSTQRVTNFDYVTPQHSGIADTTQALTGLAVNTHYYVYVRTRCNARGHDEGYSEWSEGGEFTTDLTCATPDDFVARRVYSTSADLAWKNVNSATAWRIFITGDETRNVDVNIGECQTVGDTVFYTLTGLQTESSYALALKANCGSDGLSNPAVDTPYITTLDNTTGITLFTVTNAEVIGRVALDAQTKSITATVRKGTDLADITFTIQYASGNCTAKRNGSAFASPADFTTPANVRVYAQDTTVYQDWVITMTEEACATPYDLAASDIERRSVTLEWGLGDTNATTFDIVTSTSALYDPAAGEMQTVSATNIAGECSYTITGLTRSTHYYVYLRTNCGAAYGQWRTVDFATAGLEPGEAPCPGVTEVEATAVSENSVEVTWTACTGDYANTSDIYYTTQDTAGVSITPQITGVAGSTAQIAGLAQYTLYNIYVRTHCDGEGHDDGTSRWEGTTVRTLAPCRVPGTPQPTVTGKHSATITWSNTSGTAAQANDFTYIFSPTAIPFAELSTTAPTATHVATVSADFEGMASSSTHHFYIRNECGTSTGSSPWDSCTVTMPIAMPAVVELQAADVAHNAFTATWESDTAQFADETEWEVALMPHGVTPATGWTVTTTRDHIATGLTPETTYDLYVRAKEGNERSAAVMTTVTTTALPLTCITKFDEYDDSDRSPFYTFYYDQHTKVNSILPARRLSEMTDQEITEMSFEIAYSEGERISANVEIYLKEVTDTVVTTPIDVTTATLVYAGTLDFTHGGTLRIPFNAPYHYNGGNLLIATQNTTADTYSEVYFYGTAGEGSYGASSGQSLSAINSFNYTGAFAPMTTFCYYDRRQCKPVYNLEVDEVTYTTARAHWYAGNEEQEWQVVNSTEPMTEGELATAPYVTVTSPYCALTGLMRGTEYYLYVRGVCSDTENSTWEETQYETIGGGNAYTVSATASSALGTIAMTCSANDTTADGRFYENTTPTFTATPNAGMNFSCWTNAVTGDTLSTANPWTIQVSSDSLIVGNFGVVICKLNVAVAQGFETYATVTGGGYYSWGSDVVVTAAPVNSHSEFTGWSNGEQQATTTIHLTSDSSLTANFVLDTHTVTALVNEDSMGSVAGGGVFEHGTSVTLRATPAANHHFVAWSNGVTTSTLTLTADIDTVVTANFAIDTHTLTLNVNEATLGSVTGAGTYNHGADVVVTATPVNSHSVFTGWSNGETTPTLTLTLTGDSALTANFVLDQHTITAMVNDTSMGSVTGAGTFVHGTSVTLTANPAANHHFVAWSNGATTPTLTLTLTLTLTDDTVVTAIFAKDTHEITAVPNDASRGIVTGSGVYNYGDTAVLIAKALYPYQFLRWNNTALSTTDTLRYVVRQDTTLTAFFKYIEVDVIARTSDVTMGSASGGGTYAWGSAVTLTATPAAHHHLVRWSNGATVLTQNVTVTSDTIFTAELAIDSFLVTAAPNDTAMGNVSGTGLYPYGAVVAVTATPAANHHFVKWSDGVTAASRQVTVTRDSMLIAEFAIDRHTLAVNVNNANLGSVTGAGTYDYGTEVIVTAVPKDNHSVFTGWSNGVTTPTLTVTLTGDSALTANFVLDQHTVTAMVNDSTMGSVTGAGTYVHGTSVTLTALPSLHYHFVGWSNGVTTPTLTLTLTADTVVTANFAIDRHTLTAIPDDVTHGVVTGSGTYNYGDTAVLVATALYPYTFVRWDDAAATTTDTLRYVVRYDATVTAVFRYSDFDVTTHTNDGAMGTTSGDGKYVWGTTATLVATPAAHHHLLYWSNGETTESINVVVTSDTTLTATFAIDTFNITVVPNDSTIGSVSGSGLYPYGAVVGVVATPAANHHFVAWSDGVTAASRQLTVSSDSMLIAEFAIDRHTLAVNVNNANLGSVTGAGTYDYGTDVVVTAVPKDNHSVFTGWSNGVTTPTLTLTLTGDSVLTANFVLDQHTVTAMVNDSTMGSVTGAGTFVHGTSVTLTALPALHYHFVGWSNGVTTSTLTLTLTADTVVNANFAIDRHVITVVPNDAARGTVTGSGTYDYGDSIVIIAKAVYPYTFARWDDRASTTTDTLHYIVRCDTTLTAIFRYNDFDIKVYSNDGSMGTVAGGGAYTYGTEVTLTATPAAHHHLVRWSNGDTTLTLTLTLTDDTVFTAYFAIDTFNITAAANDPAMGSVSGSGLYTYGSVATLVASPVAHHHLVDWSNGVTTPTLTLTLTSDTVVTANFAIDSHTLTLNVNDSTLGSVAGAGRYDYGSDVIVTAIPVNSHSVFTGWSNGVTTPSLTLTLTGDSALTANFVLDQHTITAMVNDTVMGSVTGAGTYVHGTSVTLTALPALHYHFVGWSNGVTTPTLTLTLTDDTVVTANFAIDSHVITAIPNDSLRGVVTGSGVYNYGDTAVLIATARYPYEFVRWNNRALSTTDTLRYVVRRDTTLTATFKYIDVNVIARTNDNAMGSASGSGTYVWGSDVSLVATPAPHHHLLHWSNGATTPTLTLTLTADTVVTAYFAIDTFNVTGVPDDTTMGSVTGSALYPYYSVATLVATPAPHYHFTGWSNGLTTETINIHVVSDSNLVANFAIDTHTLALSVNDASLGSVTGAGIYNYGDSVTITATPVDNHSIFTGWSNGVTTPTLTLTLTGDSALTANFVLDQHTITAMVNDTSMGSVTGAGTFVHGTSVTLTANPAAHHHFVGWSNGVTTSTLTLTLTGDTVVTANFAIDSHVITAVPNDSLRGVVTGSGVYNYGDTAVLVARSLYPFTFVRWDDNYSTTTDTLRYVVHYDATVTAIFTYSEFVVATSSNDATMGSTTGDGTFIWGDTATLVAIPAAHHHLVGWSNGETSETINIVVTRDTLLSAIFAIDSFYVSALSNDTTMGSVTGSARYPYGAVAGIVATPAAHHHLASWSNGVTTPTLTLTLTSDTVVTANFAIDTHTLALNVNVPSLGSVTGAGTYNYGDSVTITATPINGHSIFNGWSNGVTTPTLTLTLTGDSALTANFMLDSHTISANVNDSSMGSVSGAGSYVHGSSVTLTAIPAAHHHFVGWSNGMTNPSFTVIADADSTVTAYFAIDSHVITAVPNDSLRGVVTGSGTYNYGDTAMLVASAIHPYQFTRWDDPASTTSDTLYYVVRCDTVLTASFRLGRFTVSTTTNDTAMGTTSGDGNYVYGSTATLVATPAADHHLVSWSNGATSDTISVTVLSDTLLTATFAVDSFYIYVSSNDPAWGSASGSGDYEVNSVATLVATPAPHYHFVDWSNGVTTDTQTVVVTRDSAIIANFAIDEFTVTATANDSLYGYTLGSGIYEYGSNVTLFAIPNAHHHFVSWSNGDTATTISFVLTGDTSLVAYFAVDQFTVTADVNDPLMGYAIGSGTYSYGDTVTLTATPNSGYRFDGWSNGDTSMVLSFVVVSDTVITAVFSEIPTSLDQPEADSYITYVEYNDVVIAGAADHTLSLYDMNGRLVKTITHASDLERISVHAAGVYILRVNGLKPTRILIK